MLPSGDSDPNGPMLGASRVGAELRAARLRLGWTLPDVAATLRIRLPFLQAIEDGRIADLPGNAYALGFLRSYAASLGLDASEVARRFRAGAREVNQKPELTFPAPVPDRGVPAGAVVLLGVLLTLGAYAGWYRVSGDARSWAEAIPAVPQRLKAFTDQAAPSSSLSPKVASNPPGPPAPEPAPEPAASTPDMPLGMAPHPAAISALSAAAVTNEGRVVLRVRADAWIQVKERQGPVLLNRVMRAGDSWPVPNGTQLLLSTGNAGGTELLVDGEAIPALGPAGAVRRDVALDPDALKGGSTARPAAQ